MLSITQPPTTSKPQTTTLPPKKSTTSSPTTRFKFAEDENYLYRRSFNREASSPEEQPFNPYLSQTDLNSQKINQLNAEIEKTSKKVDEIAELRNRTEKIDAKRRRKIGK